MDKINYQHIGLANGRWNELTLNQQFGNIGSEISRALKSKNETRMLQCIDRALELTDITIKSFISKNHSTKELCRSREILCDYFYGNNIYKSNEKSIQKYYDDFIFMANKKQQK